MAKGVDICANPAFGERALVASWVVTVVLDKPPPPLPARKSNGARAANSVLTHQPRIHNEQQAPSLNDLALQLEVGLKGPGSLFGMGSLSFDGRSRNTFSFK